jgi:hypothetical protein
MATQLSLCDKACNFTLPYLQWGFEDIQASRKSAPRPIRSRQRIGKEKKTDGPRDLFVVTKRLRFQASAESNCPNPLPGVDREF